MEQLAVDPTALLRAEEADEIGTVLRLAHTAERNIPCELGYLLLAHPAGIGRAGIDDVRRDSKVAELLRGGKDDAIHRAFARAVGHVEVDMVARQTDNAAIAGFALESPTELTNQQPGSPRVNGEVEIEALHRGAENVRIDGLTMREHQRCHGTEGGFGGIEDLCWSRDVGEVGLDRGGLRTPCAQLRVELLDLVRMTTPGHRRIVGAPVVGGDVPATIGKPQRDGGADPPLATRPGHQSDLLACPSVVHTRLLVFAHSSPISLRSIRPTRESS